MQKIALIGNMLNLQLMNRFKFAFNGLKVFLLEESNAKTHLALCLFTIAAGAYFEVSKIEWLSIFICSAIVFTAEALNSAIERLCDKIEPNKDDKIKIIKDIAAGAVLLSSIFSAIVGVIIFIPHIISLF